MRDGAFQGWSRDGHSVYLREYATVDKGMMYDVFRYAVPENFPAPSIEK